MNRRLIEIKIFVIFIMSILLTFPKLREIQIQPYLNYTKRKDIKLKYYAYMYVPLNIKLYVEKWYSIAG